MGATSTRRSTDERAQAGLHVAVAASGGRDSTALLHATLRWAATHGARVHALHVHHGLQAQADRWRARLRTQVQRWARSGHPVQWHETRLSGRPAPAQSVEAWARRHRHEALQRMALAAGCDVLLLAHHRRDQAETVLLQSLRGATSAGTAAMPARQWRSGLLWARPWLDQPRQAIEAYLARHRLAWIEDESNSDETLARNRLRRRVWPGLLQAFPDAEPALARVAAQAAGDTACLQALAALDLLPCGGGAAGPFDARPLWALSSERRLNALRWRLATELGRDPPYRLLEQIAAASLPDKPTRWSAPGGCVTWLDGWLAFEAEASTATVVGSRTLDLRRCGDHELGPGLGRLRVAQASEGGGVASHCLEQVELRARAGDDRIVLRPGGMARCLKKQFQLRRVPAWSRQSFVLTAGGRTLYVPGLGLDARWLAEAGPDCRALEWLPPG